MIRIRLCLRTLTFRSMISMVSSTNRNLSSTFSSSNNITSVSSNKHFFRFEMWKHREHYPVCQIARVCRPLYRFLPKSRVAQRIVD
ncbi:hypothetical protein HanRHA438_Chr14g0653511 [Helianthus annuus]|nr:hypothetical protein HanRHA438_Chr14g0653511 [Helianthus annuus]